MYTFDHTSFIRDKGASYYLLIDQSGGTGRTRKAAIHNRRGNKHAGSIGKRIFIFQRESEGKKEENP